MDLLASDTRVFLFHSDDASTDPGGAMDKVNTWLGKDRSGSAYSNLRVRDISVGDDGKGGVYTTIVCSLGRAAASAPSTAATTFGSTVGSATGMGSSDSSNSSGTIREESTASGI